MDKQVPLDRHVRYITGQAKICLSEDARRHVRDLEKQIDQIVYKLYDHTPEEIEIVERSE